MLPSYGVLVGAYAAYTREQGQRLHVDMNVQVGETIYQAAVDVNEPQGQFQYLILTNLDAGLFAAINGLPIGWHDLRSTASSGAMDYARSPILVGPLGCLSLFFAFIGAATRARLSAWNDVTGDEAGNALVAMIEDSTRVFVFGAPYATGNGVHDGHCNQGDPPGPFQTLDGVWQDGCVVARMNDGTISAYLGKFATQTLDTTNAGLPKY